MKPVLAARNRISPEEIAYLAYIAWEKDGRPEGRAVDYWLETEIQWKATKRLLQRENPQRVPKRPRVKRARSMEVSNSGN